MRLVDRINNAPNRVAAGGDDGNASDGLDQARSESDRLLAAGDEAIRRALAGGNSEAFLRSAMQQGGQ